MNNRNRKLASLMNEEALYQQYIADEWVRKIVIYADMLFTIDPHDFIDFMTGGMAYASAILALLNSTHDPQQPNSIYKMCFDPAVVAENTIGLAGSALFFGAMHMLYRYLGDNGYDLANTNRRIANYSERKLAAMRQRYTLFPESNKSYISSAVESVRNYFKI